MNRLRTDESGGPLAEFALVFPVVLALVMGIVDMSMLLWHWTSTVKATHIGARDAIVRPIMAPGATVNWTGDFYSENLGRACVNTATGNPNTAVDSATGQTRNVCPSIDVSCTGSTCLSGFTQMLRRMQLVQPRIQPQNVEVRYVSTMLGYVGRTGGNPVTVTVTVKCLTFNLFFLDAWYRWSNQPGDCPAGTPLGARVAAASSFLSEGLSKPTSQP